ncbi:MAG TPA: type VI secretion system tip protein TssI/VgrG [Pirellulales bacterium]|nr:type VI secretion system tip protein TssI/VgrG [Pirellulales bacterium]
MAAFTQENRTIALEAPTVGDDVLLLQAFHGQERLSGLFEYELEMLSEQDSISPDDIVGKNVSFSVKDLDNSPRYFNGFVSQFAYYGRTDRLHQYRAQVVPWLWFLTRTTDCRIFQNKSVPDIIKAIFSDLGFTDFKLQLNAQYQPREYCVQYNETDFQFVSRLMEDEGIFYFFEHEDGTHTLTLADSTSGYVDCQDNQLQFGLIPVVREVSDNLASWEHRYQWRSGKLTHTDYNFKTPSTDLRTQTNSVLNISDNSKFDLYEFPGVYEKTDAGKSLAKIRMEEVEAGYDTVLSSGRAPSLNPGAKFTVSKHIVSAEEGSEYAVAAIWHQADAGAAYSTGQDNRPPAYANRFTCIPSDVVYRPPRVTPYPQIHGVQTAVVTGPSGEEIWPDEFGRVKVQFPWDREGKHDEHSSCWMRVSQVHAGKGWGGMSVPRIGEEVLVAFLEGDPDRPIVVGRMYNAAQTVPYTLPANKTQSGMKSRSSHGGSTSNYNEFRFEDKKGHEQVLLHAERNQMIEVEVDEQHWVGHDRTKTIDHDETTHVKHDRTETVDNNETITIHGNRTETVDKDETITIGESRVEVVGKNETITIGASRTESVGKDESITIASNRTESVGQDESITIAGNRSESVGQDESVSIGGARSTSIDKADALSVGTDLVINAGSSITITTGDASIVLRKDGTISINGKDISISGSGEINAKADKNVTIKGQKILQN